MDKRFGINMSQRPFMADWLDEHGEEEGLEKLGVGSYGAGIRFMDWQHLNNSQYVDARDEPKVNMGSSGSWRPYPFVSRETIYNAAKHFKTNLWIGAYHLQYQASMKENILWYMSRMSQDDAMCKKIIYWEFSNEVWNSNFEQHQHGLAVGNHPSTEFGLPWNVIDFWQTKLKEMRWALDEIYVEDTTGHLPQVKIVLSVQHRWDWWAVEMLNALSDRKWIDALAIAPYYGWYIKEKMPSRKELYMQTCHYLRGEYTDKIKRHVDLATQAGLQFLAYEGGQHFACEIHLRDKLRLFVNSSECYALEELAINQWLQNVPEDSAYFRYSLATPHEDIEYAPDKFRRGELWGLNNLDNFDGNKNKRTKRHSLIDDLKFKG